MCINIEGFHGTDSRNAKSILETGYRPSTGDDHWLGDGIYFFLKGINKDPKQQAKNWACRQSFSGKNKPLKYLNYSVFNVNINVIEDKFLDLTTSEGLEVFEYYQDKFIAKCISSGISEKSPRFQDGEIINFVRSENIDEIDVVKGNFYIKLKANERKIIGDRRTPNCTICTVYEASTIIKNTQIEKGKI